MKIVESVFDILKNLPFYALSPTQKHKIIKFPFDSYMILIHLYMFVKRRRVLKNNHDGIGHQVMAIAHMILFGELKKN